LSSAEQTGRELLGATKLILDLVLFIILSCISSLPKQGSGMFKAEKLTDQCPHKGNTANNKTPELKHPQ
jgi:hypothetical protein